MRSGWKGSMASSFSPTPISLIGQPVTARMLSAAPPRPSPSTRVSAIPVRPIRSWKAPAMVTASWPVSASATSRVSAGCAASRTALHSAIDSSSTWRRPAVSSRTTSWPSLAPAFIARRAMATALSPGTIGSTSTSACTPSAASCSMAAGRLVSSEAISTALLLAHAQEAAELGGGGGLAGALEADHEDGGRRAGGGDADLGGRTAQHLDQAVVDDLDHLLAGRDALQHVRADRLLAHVRDEVLDHRERHVRLKQGDPHLAQRGVHIRLAERTAPRQRLEDPAEPAGKTIEHAPLPPQRNPRRCAKLADRRPSSKGGLSHHIETAGP